MAMTTLKGYTQIFAIFVYNILDVRYVEKIWILLHIIYERATVFLILVFLFD